LGLLPKVALIIFCWDLGLFPADTALLEQGPDGDAASEVAILYVEAFDAGVFFLVIRSSDQVPFAKKGQRWVAQHIEGKEDKLYPFYSF